MSIKDTIREYLPDRHREKGGEMYFTLDDAKDLLKLAKSSGWLIFGVEYFIEVDRVHYSRVGVDYWPDNVSMEDRYKELEEKYESGFPWEANLAAFGFA